MASVKFKYGPKGDIEEEMNFVKINEKWYLSHFRLLNTHINFEYHYSCYFLILPFSIF